MALSYPTIDVVLDTRRPKKSGAFPVRLRITYQRIQKYYKLKFDAEQKLWDEAMSGNKAGAAAAIRRKVDGVKAKAKVILEVFEKRDSPFDFSSFEREYFGETLEPVRERESAQDVLAYFDRYADQLDRQKRAATAVSYRTARRSLEAYQAKIQFADITPQWLEAYETSMVEEGKRSLTTVGIYLRSLRTIFNQALEAGVVTRKGYPFGKNRYQIPVGRNVKKALTRAEVQSIREYPTQPGTMEDRAKAVWLFSYFCNGMNPKDITQLRWRDLHDDRLVFLRAKTKRTTRANPQPVTVYLTDPVREIIKQWGRLDTRPDARIFPFVTQGLTPQAELDAKNQFVKMVNKYMKRIGEKLGITKPLTTYVARHSWATALKRSGVSTDRITEAMGKTNSKTVQSYLDSVDDGELKEMANLLL